MEESTLCCFPKEQQPMEREGTCWIRGKMRGGMRTDNPLNCFCGDREIGNESVAEPGKRLVRGVVVLKFCPCFSVSGPTLIRNKINFPQVESVWLMIVTIKWSPHHLHLDQWDCSSYFVLSRWSVVEWLSECVAFEQGQPNASTDCSCHKRYVEQFLHGSCAISTSFNGAGLGQFHT